MLTVPSSGVLCALSPLIPIAVQNRTIANFLLGEEGVEITLCEGVFVCAVDVWEVLHFMAIVFPASFSGFWADSAGRPYGFCTPPLREALGSSSQQKTRWPDKSSWACAWSQAVIGPAPGHAGGAKHICAAAHSPTTANKKLNNVGVAMVTSCDSSRARSRRRG